MKPAAPSHSRTDWRNPIHKKLVIVDVPPIHQNGLDTLARAGDVDVVMFDWGLPLAEFAKDASAILAGLSIIDEQVMDKAHRQTAKGDVGSNTTLHCKRKNLTRCSPTRIPGQTEIDIAEWEE